MKIFGNKKEESYTNEEYSKIIKELVADNFVLKKQIESTTDIIMQMQNTMQIVNKDINQRLKDLDERIVKHVTPSFECPHTGK